MRLGLFCGFAGVLVSIITVASAFAANPQEADTTKPEIYAKAYGSWVYRCVQVTPKGESPVKNCEVMQGMFVKQDGHEVQLATISFEKSSTQPGYNFGAVLPLGVLLPPGVSFSADAGSPITKAIDFCNQGGCVILPQPAEGLVDELKSGKQGHINFIYMNGRRIAVNFSLDGFGQAIAALEKGKLPPRIKNS